MKLVLRLSLVFVMTNMCLVTAAHAQQLGGGESPDISIWRILLTLLFCLFIGLLLIWFLYSRNMGQSHPTAKSVWLSKLPFWNETSVEREIEILDMRKLNAQSDACLLRCRERDYLLLLGSDGVKILSEQATESAAPNDERAS